MDTTEINLLSENELNRRHVLAILSRIDLLIRREVRRWQLAGQDPSDTFRGLYISDNEAKDLAVRAFATNWGSTISLEQDEEKAFACALTIADELIENIRNAAQSRGYEPSLDRLMRVFSLSSFELYTIAICLAPHLDIRYERLYGYLQDDVTRKLPTVNLVLNLLCEPGEARLPAYSNFFSDAALLRNNLISLSGEGNSGNFHLLSRTIHLDETIAMWIMGQYQPGEGSRQCISVIEPPGEEDLCILAGNASGEIEKQVDKKPILVFYGPDRTSQDTAALFAGKLMNQKILKADLSAAANNEIPVYPIIRKVLRDSIITGYLPYFYAWDNSLEDGILPESILQELCDFPNAVIISGRNFWHAIGISRNRPFTWLEFPIPNYEQRLTIWDHFLVGEVSQGSMNVPALAGAFALTTTQIRDAVASAKDLANKHGDVITQDYLYLAARAHSNPRLATLARKLTPRYEWTDIVLPEDQINLLREIITTVRTRPKVLEEWGLGLKLVSSRGITILFAGPPGTGKTMAAEIIAQELKLDLYKIDLANVISKYIGETEKNLERIFTEAEASNAILFFDEADALFGKRSEVRDSHDRYANIEISYLLQRMEAYDGVSILATNLRANLDEAFTRRLQFVVDFPFPSEEYRHRIWKALFPPSVPRAEDLDFRSLAKNYKIAGGNIRNILVNATYQAASDGGVLTMEHLLHGVRRELQKMGRLVEE